MTEFEALSQLTAQYCHRLDDGRLDELLELFMPDAAVQISGQTHQGRDTLSAFFTAIAEATKGARHLCVNPEFTASGDSASGVLDFMLVYADERRPLVGRYHDDYHRTDDGWRFAERRIVAAS